MRTVILKREKNFSGGAMLYQVKCDGKLVATLKNGQEKTIELDGERHGIQCFADTISLDEDVSSSRLYSELEDIPAGEDNILVSFKPGFASIKMSIETQSGEIVSADKGEKPKKKFSVGVFLLLTLCTGIGGIIYAIVKCS